MDSAGDSRVGRKSIFFLFALLFWSFGAVSASRAADRPPAHGAEELREQAPEIAYHTGLALAREGRWEEARATLLRGWRSQPRDERFPIELGGLAFKQKRYAEAARWLRRGLRLKPEDAYVTDFLATIYFLQGNVDAALEYWNRIGKPRIASVRIEPAPRVDRVLLDRAFTFAPGEALLLRDLVEARARVAGLEIFPVFRFQLNAREDGEFDVAFTGTERRGWGASTLAALVSTFRGIGYQTIYPEYFNVGGSAINLTSLLRSDEQKRRMTLEASGPIGGDPKYRYRVGIDARDENWVLRRSDEPPSGALKLRRGGLSAEVGSLHGSWSWSAGVEITHRSFRDVSAGPGLPAETLLRGYQLKSITQLTRDLWRAPQHRFESEWRLSSETGKIWSPSAHTFERLQSSVTARWLPRMSGDDYAVRQQFSAGKIFGRAPFDELYMLGLERDNDLLMRAHIGTRDGRKGSAPLGRDYFVSNWEMDKNIYGGIVSVKIGPFLDIGKTTDSAAGLGSRVWMFDTGAQAKVRVLGVGITVVYGKDLRSGRNAVYLMTGR